MNEWIKILKLALMNNIIIHEWKIISCYVWCPPLPALVTVVSELAGVGMSLGQPGELLVPLQLQHVTGAGLGGQACQHEIFVYHGGMKIHLVLNIVICTVTCGHGRAKFVMIVEDLSLLRQGQTPAVGSTTRGLGTCRSIIWWWGDVYICIGHI